MKIRFCINILEIRVVKELSKELWSLAQVISNANYYSVVQYCNKGDRTQTFSCGNSSDVQKRCSYRSLHISVRLLNLQIPEPIENSFVGDKASKLALACWSKACIQDVFSYENWGSFYLICTLSGLREGNPCWDRFRKRESLPVFFHQIDIFASAE